MLLRGLYEGQGWVGQWEGGPANYLRATIRPANKKQVKGGEKGAPKRYKRGQNESSLCQRPLPDLPNRPTTRFFELPDPKVGG